MVLIIKRKDNVCIIEAEDTGPGLSAKKQVTYLNRIIVPIKKISVIKEFHVFAISSVKVQDRGNCDFWSQEK